MLAALAIRFSGISGGVASVWPANALIVALLLLSPRKVWHRYVAATLVGNVAANVLTRDSWLGPLLFSAANIAEILLVGFAMRRLRLRGSDLFDNTTSLAKFFLWAGLIGPVVSGLLGAATAFVLLDKDFVPSLYVWVCSDALGLILWTPFFYSLFGGEYRRRYARMSAQWRLRAAVHHGLVVLSCAVFWQTDLPLLFFPFIPLMLVTFRQGRLGTTMAILIVASGATVATALGYGQIARIQAGAHGHELFLQFYLACFVVVNLPVAAFIATRHKLIRRLREDERMIELLSSKSAIAVMSFDAAGRCTMAAGKTASLLGANPQGRALRAIFGKAEDQVSQAFAALRENPEEGAMCEIDLRDGRCLETTFSAVCEGDGAFHGALVTITEITQRKNEEHRLRAIARTDILTGVLNRAGFLEQLAQTMADPDARFCLALIDLDQFKDINDTLGHMAGDAVLRHFTDIMCCEVRGADVVGRLGGDEFVVLLHGTRLPYASNICERLVHTVGTSPLGFKDQVSVCLTISCGLVEYAAGETVEALINRADMALYRAKRDGRNCLKAA